MSPVLLVLICAVSSYLLGSFNPAIELSRLIYHQDLRTLGSKNPGFTNFKRVFGNKWAWAVFCLDFAKSAVLCLIFCNLFENVLGYYNLGAAFTGFFVMIGHMYPVWYGFRGGKGVLVCAAALWFIDWRSALIALAVLVILLAVTRFMSLSVMVALATCPVTFAMFGVEHWGILALVTAEVAMIVWRHRGNIRRLAAGTESRFYLTKPPETKAAPAPPPENRSE